MPAKKSPTPAARDSDLTQHTFRLAEDAEWGGFINVRVDEEQKQEFQIWWAQSPADVPVILQELVGAGLKVTLAYDSDNDSWLCSFTGRLVAEEADRFVTTTRAGSMAEVIALACYKHVYIVRGKYKKYSNNSKPLWG